MNFDRSDALRERLHDLIPGGAHTYAKGDDQYPADAAPVIERGDGCRVWDVDGNVFLEYGMGLRSVTLGHAYPSVVAAAEQAMRRGLNFVRPAALEVAAAEALLDLLPNAEMVKFAKNGSDVTTAAVKLARAATGRDLVAMCGDQPFFSTDDWFIGATPMAAGIPQPIRDLTLRFPYNDAGALEALFAAHPGAIACVIMEAATSVEPAPGYLEAVQALCRRHGAVFILDEIITGFRWHVGGAQAVYGLQPDLAAFGKALGNGFSIAVLVGRRDLMELGGLRHDRERVFLLSTTFGAESTSLAAALEVMRIYREEGVIEHLYRAGERLRTGVAEVAGARGVAGHFELRGRPCNLVYATLDGEGRPSQPFRTLFLQELLARGVLAPSFVVSYAHSDEAIDQTVEAIDGALAVYARALHDGPEAHLRGRPVKPVMRARN
ncbi:MAG: glutamate-1-semialdehyde 2,1-aminomutase [Candidatus Limnocylindrales bacterium]